MYPNKRNGGELVTISQKMVKTCKLSTNQGTVTDGAYNTQQLVTVKVDGMRIDFHARSLTINVP